MEPKPRQQIEWEIKRQIFNTTVSLLHLQMFGRYPFGMKLHSDDMDYYFDELGEEFVAEHEIDKLNETFFELEQVLEDFTGGKK